jgi:hypothetical protein
MKRCALCHGRLGLGTRFGNIWNGRWWVHVRFCSVRCKGIYEVRQNEAAKHRWHTFLAGVPPAVVAGSRRTRQRLRSQRFNRNVYSI